LAREVQERMNIPAFDYIGIGFTWLFVALNLFAYFYIRSKTGKKWAFFIIFTAAWFVMGISYIFLVTGTVAGAWYITLIRTIGYLLFTSAIITAIVELVRMGKQAK